MALTAVQLAKIDAAVDAFARQLAEDVRFGWGDTIVDPDVAALDVLLTEPDEAVVDEVRRRLGVGVGV